MTDNKACENTDREIWRGPDDGNGSYYADSIHVTKDGGIGINCGGHVIVMPLREWHRLAVAAEPQYVVTADWTNLRQGSTALEPTPVITRVNR